MPATRDQLELLQGTLDMLILKTLLFGPAHGHGIAIDIALKHSDYWRNSSPEKDGAYAYKNEIPMEIVRVFEKHGFIWGGKWHHYDTMHFEYRPELLGADGG